MIDFLSVDIISRYTVKIARTETDTLFGEGFRFDFGLSSLLVAGSESPVFGIEGGGTGTGGSSMRHAPHELPNEISAPYEVPQFPIEQIEKKLLIQRQLTVK